MIKNKNWHNNKKTHKTNKFLEENAGNLREFTPKFEKTSFIPMENLQTMFDTKANVELENGVDFFAKDVRKKNFSFFNFAGQHFMFDR